jgi:hypothetical protein
MQRHQYVCLLWRMCDQVPRQNKKEDYTPLGHLHLVVDKWKAWDISVAVKVKYASPGPDVST